MAHGAALSVVPGALGGVPGRWRCRLSLRALSAPAGRRPLLCCRLPCPHGARCREHPTEGAAATGSRLPFGERRAGIRRSAHLTEGLALPQKERGDARRGMVRRGREGVPTERPSPGAPALWNSRELLPRLAEPAAQGRAGGEARRPRGQGGPWPGTGPRTGPPCLCDCAGAVHRMIRQDPLPTGQGVYCCIKAGRVSGLRASGSPPPPLG